MRLPPIPGKQTDKGKSINHTLERLRLSLGTDVAEWSGILGLVEREYQSVLRGRKPLPITSLESMAKYLGVSLEKFAKGEIDIPAVTARLSGDQGFLRERYKIGAFSRRWSSLNALDYVENILGWQTRALALRHLQVSEAVFSSPDQHISLRFPSDLFEYLSRRGVKDAHFFSMGTNVLNTYSNSALGKELRKANEVSELFELLCATIGQHLEKNYFYWLERLDETSCVLAGRPNPELCSIMSTHRPGNASFCLMKAGVCASLPGFLGLPYADVVEISCVHRGDPHCAYQIDFERPSHVLKTSRRISQR